MNAADQQVPAPPTSEPCERGLRRRLVIGAKSPPAGAGTLCVADVPEARPSYSSWLIRFPTVGGHSLRPLPQAGNELACRRTGEGRRTANRFAATSATAEATS